MPSSPTVGSQSLEVALAAVVVSYNVAALLERCLDSLRRELDHLGSRIVVVDNASTDGSGVLVRERFPEVTLLANESNVGFGAACNQGWHAAGEAECVLFLNSDTELRPGAARALVDRLSSTPAAAIAGPRLLYPDGEPQPSRRRFPTLATLLLENTPLEWRGPSWPTVRRYRYEGKPDGDPEPVGWLSGACLLARSAALQDVGGFDPEFFMYFEEVDLCLRLAALGWQVWFEPAAVVVHHHSQSADQNLTTKDRLFFQSKYCYATRYFGAKTAKLLRLTAGATFAAEAVVQRLRGDAHLVQRYATLARWHLFQS